MTTANNEKSLLKLNDLSILIVDDFDDATLFLSSYLKRKGASVLSAGNGLQGLELFKQHRPDIVITDIRMPILDGIAMAEAIREIDLDTPIVFLTGNAETELMRSSIGLSATDFLLKPVTIDNLHQALKKAVAKCQINQQQHAALNLLSHTVEHLQNEKQYLSGTIARLLGDDQHVAVNVLRRGQDIISGDFHCVLQHRNSLYLLLADSMGHGLPAVLPALEIPKQFRKFAGKGCSLSRIADELNQTLFDHGLVNHFVAATLVRVDTELNLVEVINCGNPEMLLVDFQGNLLHRFPANHFAWGIVGGDDFLPSLQEYRFKEPVKLYLCSDGLTEKLESAHKRPGSEALAALLKSHSPTPLQPLETWLDSLAKPDLEDDITLLEVNVPSITLAEELGYPHQPEAFPFKTGSVHTLSALLVENDSDTRNYLSQFLSRKVDKLFCANNGEEGLHLFIKHRPALIIADIQLPGMSGLALTEKIRELDSEVPIILTSGHENWNIRPSEKVEALQSLAVNKFLPKPVDSSKLLDAIQYCIEQFNHVKNLHLSASLFLSSPLAMTITDASRNIIAINPAFTQITGYTLDEVMGCNPRILSSGRHDASFYTQMWKCINATGHWCGEVWNRRKDGTVFLEWINITAIYDGDGNVCNYASIFSDITQRTYAEEKIRHLAHHDALTGLPNRSLFFDRLSQSLLQAERYRKSVAVIYLDVDHFNIINDTLGHSVGDLLIGEVASVLQKAAGESDTVSRLGGDEFAILVPEIGDEKNVSRIADKIFTATSRIYHVAGKELRVGVSMGISLYPRDGRDAETLLKRADNAMYQAKREGRNRYQIFNYTLEQKAQRHMTIQQGLYKALEQVEFYIHYQPKYALDEKRIVGAEALMRWKHPDLGELSPAEFIPIAEETGFIIKLGNWLIDQVCRDIAEWKAYGAPVVPVAVNISPIHFHRGNVRQSLLQSLTNHRLPTSLLQVELTESVVMNNQQNTLNQLQALKELGIAISIDDFGTGYSSLTYLRKLPIDELKIDRSFIMEITDEASLADSRLTAIPSTIIELGQKLLLKLVAEGVETTVQSNFLQQNGCNVIQGYLFSRPVSKDAMLKLLTAPSQETGHPELD